MNKKILSKEGWSVGLVLSGLILYFFPKWTVFSSNITTGDSMMIGTMFLVAGLLLWYLPSKQS